jgi:PIN domain nuclease of toxin-antitoxin system
MGSKVRYLLDTNAFLWLATQPQKLPPGLSQKLLMDGVDVYVSVVSAWEMQVKHGLGKMDLVGPADTLFSKYITHHGLLSLGIQLSHIGTLYRLPLAHRDPFDRLLAAQALAEGLTIASPDPMFRHYPVTVEWSSS